MNRHKLIVASAVVLALGVTHIMPVLASSGHSLDGPFGYVNLTDIKNTYPPAANLERLKVEAEARLQLAVLHANEELDKARKDGKPQSEQEKMAQDFQHEIKGRQDSASEMLQIQMFTVNQAIGSAVQEAAKEKGIELVIDGSGVLLGGKKIVDNGIDITGLVKKKLLAVQTPIEAPKPEEKQKTETPQK